MFNNCKGTTLNIIVYITFIYSRCTLIMISLIHIIKSKILPFSHDYCSHDYIISSCVMGGARRWRPSPVALVFHTALSFTWKQLVLVLSLAVSAVFLCVFFFVFACQTQEFPYRRWSRSQSLVCLPVCLAGAAVRDILLALSGSGSRHIPS